MAEQYQRHISEQDTFLFGSDTDRRKEQYRQNMLNQLKEMMPQLVQMMMMTNTGQPTTTINGMSMPPLGMSMQMPLSGGGGGQQQGNPSMMQMNHMQQAAAAAAAAAMNNNNNNGMAGMMMNNPMAAAAAAAMQGMNGGGGSMPQQMNPMMMNGVGGGMSMPMMNTGGGMMDQPPPPPMNNNMGRRARRRNGFALDDGFDEDYEDFRPRRGGFKRQGRNGGIGGGAGNWRDDDDMLGGFAGGEYVTRPLFLCFFFLFLLRSWFAVYIYMVFANCDFQQVCMILEDLQEEEEEEEEVLLDIHHSVQAVLVVVA